MAEEGDEIEGQSLVAAGGGVDRTAATTEPRQQMTNLEWGKAACSEDAIQKCVAAGAFHPGELIEWRAPVKDKTPALSTLEDQFVILSLCHVICGLRLDASDFLVSVLSYYKLEWSHLTPNSITALSMFAHLCEAYLGVPPTVEVFTHFYTLYHNMKGETTTLGSVYFRLRDRMKKSYPLYYLKASQFYWVSLWFYAKVPHSCRLTFRCDALEDKSNWKDLLPLSSEQEEQVVKITELSNQGLTGKDIVRDYLKHRISPLRRRTHLACDYSGLSDPTRDSDKDLSVEDIESKLSYLLDLKKTSMKQPADKPNVPTSLVRASAIDHANQPFVSTAVLALGHYQGLLNASSTQEAKKKSLEEITASIKTTKSSMITYKSQVRRASLRRYTRQSAAAAARKVVVPLPLEIDPSPTQGSDPEEEILDAIANITTGASPNQAVEQKSVERPDEVKEGRVAELTKAMFSSIGAKRKASAPRSRSQRRAKYSVLSIVKKTRMSSLDNGSIKGTSSTKEAVLAPSLADEAGSSALFMLANALDSRPKVVVDSMSNVLLNRPARDFSCEEVDPAQSISEVVRDQEAIDVSAAITVHNREEVNSEVIWERMQKVQSEYVAYSVATSSELLEQAKKLVSENKRLKDREIMLEQQVKELEDDRRLLKERMTENKRLKDREVMLEQQVKELEDGRRILKERMTEAEQEAFKIVEENLKLKDEIKGQKQMIEELSKQNESSLGALVQKCAELNRHKNEAAQLIKEKEELQVRVSRVNDIARLLSSTCTS